ncbi:MAG: ABC transporter permease [Clostridiaceae bacterium]|nr:ABC transporter permease [Clostridiaceae bacterium]
MYFKMAVRNVKKSFKDYGIYFLTLALAVCIFYSFNSIESQQVISEMRESKNYYGDSLIKAVSYISVLVSIIIGCLMIYANNFLIKRRSGEFAIYMTLGMSKRIISKILFYETVVVGFIALIVGLLIGFGISQCLSLLVINLFNKDMSKYAFVLSMPAILKTILYFGIMFIIVMIFNSISMSKYKIIDLIRSGRKNEKIKYSKPIVSILAFIISIATLGYSYYEALTEKLNFEGNTLIKILIAGAIGSVLFFYSISSLTIYLYKRQKKNYYRGLNVFIVKQISSKIKTNFVSMSLIAIMLFVTILSLSTGISKKNSMEENLRKSTPYDASVNFYLKNYDEGNAEKAKAKIKEVLKDKDDFGEKTEFINAYIDKNIKVNDYVDYEYNNNIIFVKESEYNKNRKLINKGPIKLSDNEVLLVSSYDDLEDKINNFIKDNGKKIKIKNKEYHIQNDKVCSENFSTDIVPNCVFTIVINDKFCDDLSWCQTALNVEFPDDNIESCEEKYSDNLILNDDRNEEYRIESVTKKREEIKKTGITAIMLLVLIYIGFVFMITSIAVLAIQQLSEASDSIERYNALKRIGANEKMISKTIFRQIFIYFFTPVILAIVHSIVGIKAVVNSMTLYGNHDILKSSLLAIIIFIVIYFGYFIVTYKSYKGIVKFRINSNK